MTVLIYLGIFTLFVAAILRLTVSDSTLFGRWLDGPSPLRSESQVVQALERAKRVEATLTFLPSDALVRAFRNLKVRGKPVLLVAAPDVYPAWCQVWSQVLEAPVPAGLVFVDTFAVYAYSRGVFQQRLKRRDQLLLRTVIDKVAASVGVSTPTSEHTHRLRA